MEPRGVGNGIVGETCPGYYPASGRLLMESWSNDSRDCSDYRWNIGYGYPALYNHCVVLLPPAVLLLQEGGMGWR
ncbi:hypothetical protein chiPu_0018559 [Chiloscyllium punctatum]|uniref:Uncharacterized protein n=1 Tax=Chiloscyllium punctatum TaxID=137246 RepID=A0A401RNQ6_CHIPU|nr:hypothetical protein [Chiloscyllium punctatum]